MTVSAAPYPVFVGRKGLAEIVAPLGLTPEGFQTLPGAPKPVVWSPRRRRWRSAEILAFIRRLEGVA